MHSFSHSFKQTRTCIYGRTDRQAGRQTDRHKHIHAYMRMYVYRYTQMHIYIHMCMFTLGNTRIDGNSSSASHSDGQNATGIKTIEVLLSLF